MTDTTTTEARRRSEPAQSVIDMTEFEQSVSNPIVCGVFRLSGKECHQDTRTAEWRLLVEHNGGGHQRTIFYCSMCVDGIRYSSDKGRLSCLPCASKLARGVPMHLITFEPL